MLMRGELLRTIQILGLVSIVALVCAPTAYAYLDAGTGSLILQILLGGVAGILVGWKFFWHRLRAWLVGWRKK